jgi:oligoribonuclease
MKYISIDVETTGLNPLYHQILEFGAVIDALPERVGGAFVPIDQLPKFHAYVKHSMVSGSAFALSMHPKILRKIADQKDEEDEDAIFVEPRELPIVFMEWCQSYNIDKITPLGKNFGIFDAQFLKRLPDWENQVKMGHRCLDPAMYWISPNDDVPPDLSTCLKRAGFDSAVKHNAVCDALDTILVFREGIKRMWIE